MKINKLAAVFGTLLVLGGCGIPDEPVTTTGTENAAVEQTVTSETENTETVTTGSSAEDTTPEETQAVDETDTEDGNEDQSDVEEQTPSDEVQDDGTDVTDPQPETVPSLDEGNGSQSDDDNRGCIGDEGLVW